MYHHGPNCLRGPATRAPGKWACFVEESPETLAELLPCGDATSMNPDAGDPFLADPPIRTDLVERVRREIAEGTYETPEKWEAALDRLLQRLEGEVP